MKRLLILLFSVSALFANGQFNTKITTPTEYRTLKVDTLIIAGDTIPLPASLKNLVVLCAKSDALYMWSVALQKYILVGSGGGSLGVTSVDASINGTAISISGNPITSSGTFAFSWTGLSNQYVRANGSKATLSTDVIAIGDPRWALVSHSHIFSDITDGTTAVRNLFSAGTGLSYNSATGVFSWTGSSSGISSLNGLTGSTQTFATGTSGSDFNISSVGTAHTFNFPNASASNRGLLTSTDWTTFNNKISPSDTANKWASNFYKRNDSVFFQKGSTEYFAYKDSSGGSSISTTPLTLTDASTVTWDYSISPVAKVTLGGNRTLSVSNVPDGQVGVLKVKQDATGSRTLTLPGISNFTLSTAANAENVLQFVNYGGTLYWTADVWDASAINTGNFAQSRIIGLIDSLNNRIIGGFRRNDTVFLQKWNGTSVVSSFGWKDSVGASGGSGGSLPSLSQYHFYVGDVSSAPVDAGSGINYQNNVFSLDKYAVVDTIYGSTASGGNLYLFSTSHATKGKIFLSGASAYDVTNQRMGFGTTSPISPLHVVADYTINPNSFITIDQAPYTAMDIGVNSSGQAIIDFSGDLKFRTKAYAARGGGSYTNIPLTISYSTGYLNLGVAPATYSSGGFDVLARNQTTGSVEKVTVTFTETVQEFTGSTSSGITLSNTPMSGKAELYFLNGVLIKSSNISRTGTTVTLSGFTRESSDVITAKYSY